MTTIPKLKIKCRIEEVPAIGGFVINSMTPLADFTGYSSDYNAAFVTQASTDQLAIEALINPKQLTAELKVITKRIYTNQDNLRPKIDALEGYINRATGLTMGKKDFGISAVRTKNNNGDIEGLVSALSFLISNVSVSANLTAIQAKGYTAAQHTALIAIKDSFKSDNIAQNTKINERNNKVISNYIKINAFWDKIVDICDVGKRIYKSTAPNRLDDFTMAKLKKRVNQERSNTLFQGVITAGTTPINGAKVEMKPLLTGRRRTAKSKADGTFVISSLEPGDYKVIISATGIDPQTVTVNIITGSPTAQNFDLS